MNDINTWAGFGLAASPFFNQPLEPDPRHPTRPITLFVGREEESRLVVNRVKGSNSSVTFVTGSYGVGKTTFLHHLRYRLSSEPKVTVASAPIRVVSSTSAEALAAEVLRRMLAGVDRFERGDRIRASPQHKEAEQAVLRVDKWSGSLSIMGIGGGLGSSTLTPPHPVHDLVSLVYGLAGEMLKAAPEMSTVIHVDNLENAFDPSNVESGWLLMRDIRDLLQVDGVHMLMCGGLDFYRGAIHREQKVADVVGSPVVLAPLSKEMAWNALERRVRHLARKGQRPTMPVSKGAFEALHDVYSGNLRGMFTITGLSLETRPPSTSGPVAWDDLIPSARKAALDQVGSVASRREIEYLRTIYIQFRQREFRQADLARHLDVSQPQVSRMMDRLQTMRLVELVREEPPSKYLRLAGLTLIALGWNPGGDRETGGRDR